MRELVIDGADPDDEVDDIIKGEASIDTCWIENHQPVSFKRTVEKISNITRKELDDKVTDVLRKDNAFWVKYFWHTDDFGEGESDLIYNPIYVLADSSEITMW